MDAGGIILLVGYICNFICIIFILFFEHSDSARRFSWILAVAFIPVVGVLLYIFLSGNFFTRSFRMMKATRFAHTYYSDLLDKQTRNLSSLVQDGLHKNIEEYASLIHMNLVYGKSPLSIHNNVEIFISGSEKYKALFFDILHAKHNIHLSYFIINNDVIGKELIRILALKAQQGVRVRLLYDHVGSLFTAPSLFQPLKESGGSVQRFFPISLFNPFSFNYRNHRKIAVIDGTIGYFGGMNIGDEYANSSSKRDFYWRDTHLRFTGNAVELLQKQFLIDWYTATSKKSDIEDAIQLQEFFPTFMQDTHAFDVHPSERLTENVPMQIVASGPDDKRNDEIRDALIHCISKAKKSVYIQTPYFTPDIAFYSALKIAALSGKDVRIIIPQTWDKWYARLAAMPFVEDLLQCGVHFWYYKGFMHAKMFIIDESITSIGSTNVDTRSFALHFELNGFFYSEAFAKKCASIFLDDQNKSIKAELKDFTQAHLLTRGLWNFFKLFSPLM